MSQLGFSQTVAQKKRKGSLASIIDTALPRQKSVLSLTNQIHTILDTSSTSQGVELSGADALISAMSDDEMYEGSSESYGS